MVPLVYESYNVNNPSLIRSPKSYLVIVLAKTWAIPGPLISTPIAEMFLISFHFISYPFNAITSNSTNISSMDSDTT
jgi:hypothetical protein